MEAPSLGSTLSATKRCGQYDRQTATQQTAGMAGDFEMVPRHCEELCASQSTPAPSSASGVGAAAAAAAAAAVDSAAAAATAAAAEAAVVPAVPAVVQAAAVSAGAAYSTP